MIARVWKGWTRPELAEAYERLLREVVYPELQIIPGYRAATFSARMVRRRLNS